MADATLARRLPRRYRFLLSLDGAAVPAAIPAATAAVDTIIRSWAGPAAGPPRRDGAAAEAAAPPAAAAAAEMADALEGPLWALWGALHTAAARTPAGRQGPLVDLLVGIASLPPPRRADGATVTVWGAAVWSGLPVWGADVREAFNTDATDPAAATPWTTVAWPRFNAFLARVTAAAAAAAEGAVVVAGPARKTLSSAALHGLWALRDGLEGAPSSATVAAVAGAAEAAGAVGAVGAVGAWVAGVAGAVTATPLALHAAAVWLAHASPALWRASRDGVRYDGLRGAPGDGCTSRPWRGYTVDRWAHWRAGVVAAAAAAKPVGEGGGGGGDAGPSGAGEEASGGGGGGGEGLPSALRAAVAAMEAAEAA
ncbi:hypothetical protein I4F81_001306 [Pyropia yezoensis]|uniref:Uncharacterized protein n=1 Tax=Pyropia yezoensis TaxID=2788 RepID=A0ACC3BLA3_PYRYE|nr:hypothetical protein I4F81_001306 [Neopyropia yezoensis]